MFLSNYNTSFEIYLPFTATLLVCPPPDHQMMTSIVIAAIAGTVFLSLLVYRTSNTMHIDIKKKCQVDINMD
jgi:hypothetical protein